MVITIYIIVTLTFFMFRLMPGDPVSMLVTEDLSEEAQEMVRKEWGLDKPLWVRFGIYIKDLATLDLGVTCFIFIALFGVHRVLRRPSWPNLVVGGVFLGLALGAKVSALIVLPVSVGLIFLWGFGRWRKKLIPRLVIYLSVAFLALWAVHLFDFGPPPGFSIPLPAPTYWNSFSPRVYLINPSHPDRVLLLTN